MRTTYKDYKESLDNFVQEFSTEDLTEDYHYDHFRDCNLKSRKYNKNHGREFFTDNLGWIVADGSFKGKYLIRTANGKSAEFAYYRYYILEGTQHNYKVYRVNIDDLPVKVAKKPKWAF
tara:strand:+ start:218 stop:574 length:357 start_codon:yes stop_codon:yes gene_type:complete